MTARTGITVDLKALEELESRWNQLREFAKSDTAEAEKLALNAAQILVGEIRETVMETSSGSTRSVSPRTGALARSFREEVKVAAGVIRIGAFSDLVYAAIQDRGGRITPRTRKSLAIPMTSKAAIRWPRDWPKDELFRPRGKDYLASKKGKKGIEVQYLLRKSVRIKPKDYLSKANDKALPKVAALFVRRLAEGVAGE